MKLISTAKTSARILQSQGLQKRAQYIRQSTAFVKKPSHQLLWLNVVYTKVIAVISGLPGGWRNNNNGTFNNLGSNGNWWSSSENNTNNAWRRRLDHDNATVNRNNNNKRNGFSVRCVGDILEDKGQQVPAAP